MRVLLDVDSDVTVSMGSASQGGTNRPEAGVDIFNVSAAALALLLLLPVLALIALLVGCSGPGPILYRGQRVGRGGRVMTMYKFRTMRPGAEMEIGSRLLSPKDDCVTRVGRVLRYMKLDELPQLVNVLKRDMNLIGPRPLRPVFLAEMRASIPGYERRFEVAPGITGLAQVRGGYYTSPRDKLRYDLLYVRRRTVRLDLAILMVTALIVIRRALQPLRPRLLVTSVTRGSWQYHELRPRQAQVRQKSAPAAAVSVLTATAADGYPVEGQGAAVRLG